MIFLDFSYFGSKVGKNSTIRECLNIHPFTVLSVKVHLNHKLISHRYPPNALFLTENLNSFRNYFYKDYCIIKGVQDVGTSYIF